MRPSLVDIRSSVTVAAAFAEEYVSTHPEHAEPVTHFITQILQSRKELDGSIYDERPHEQEGHDGTDAQ